MVAGPKAQFKGTGTIDGTGNYGCVIAAVDAALIIASIAVDLSHVKIWDKDDGGVVVYDNQVDDLDDADLTTPIRGGTIVVQKSSQTPSYFEGQHSTSAALLCCLSSF